MGDVNPWSYPDGLCEAKYDHNPHEHNSKTLGWFWCTANQADREPYRSERRRLEASQTF